MYLLITKRADASNPCIWGVYTKARAEEEYRKHLSEGYYTADQIELRKVDVDYVHTVMSPP